MGYSDSRTRCGAKFSLGAYVARGSATGSGSVVAYPADVTLRLIGAGLPRTGTSSLREALRRLLRAPVYHMSEAFAHPEHAPTWVAAIEGDPPVWDDFLAGYAAGVDAPFSTCWRDLAAAYPDAPVLLSHRGSAKVWHRSMDATVLPRTHEMLMRDDDDPMVPPFRVIFGDLFTDADDQEDVMAGTSGGSWRSARRSRRSASSSGSPVTAGS